MFSAIKTFQNLRGKKDGIAWKFLEPNETSISVWEKFLKKKEKWMIMKRAYCCREGVSSDHVHCVSYDHVQVWATIMRRCELLSSCRCELLSCGVSYYHRAGVSCYHAQVWAVIMHRCELLSSCRCELSSCRCEPLSSCRCELLLCAGVSYHRVGVSSDHHACVSSYHVQVWAIIVQVWATIMCSCELLSSCSFELPSSCRCE